MQDDDAYTRESWLKVEAKIRGKAWIPIDPEHECFQCPWCKKVLTIFYKAIMYKCPSCGQYVYFDDGESA